MEFLQSRHAKLFLVILIMMGVIVFGVLKQLEGTMPKSKKPATTQEQIEEEIAAETGEQTAEKAQLATEVQSMLETEGIKKNVELTAEGQMLKNGIMALKQSNITSAINNLKTASETSNDPAVKTVALRNLADCYLRLNDGKMIIQTYAKLLETEDNKEERKQIYERLGETYNFNKDPANALKMYQESYNIEPTVSNALKICEVYDQLHDTSNLVAQIEAYVTDNPNMKFMFEKYNQYMINSEVWNNIGTNNGEAQQSQSSQTTQPAQPAAQPATQETPTDTKPAAAQPAKPAKPAQPAKPTTPSAN